MFEFSSCSSHVFAELFFPLGLGVKAAEGPSQTANKRGLLFQDDCGVEGVLILPDSNRKKVQLGTKTASDSIRRAEHETSGARATVHQRESERLWLEANEQARPGI